MLYLDLFSFYNEFFLYLGNFCSFSKTYRTLTLITIKLDSNYMTALLLKG